MKDDIATIRHALQAAKSNAFLHRRGGLHNLWSQLVEGLEALERIEKHILPHQPSLMPNLTTALPARAVPTGRQAAAGGSARAQAGDTTKSYTHKRPEPDTMPPSSRPKHNFDTAAHKRGT